MANLDLSKYGITDVKEILHNPSYEVLFAEETKEGLTLLMKYCLQKKQKKVWKATKRAR